MVTRATITSYSRALARGVLRAGLAATKCDEPAEKRTLLQQSRSGAHQMLRGAYELR